MKDPMAAPVQGKGIQTKKAMPSRLHLLKRCFLFSAFVFIDPMNFATNLNFLIPLERNTNKEYTNKIYVVL